MENSRKCVIKISDRRDLIINNKYSCLNRNAIISFSSDFFFFFTEEESLCETAYKDTITIIISKFAWLVNESKSYVPKPHRKSMLCMFDKSV